MRELVADRFVAFDRAWIDLASGAPVRMRFGETSDRVGADPLERPVRGAGANAASADERARRLRTRRERPDVRGLRHQRCGQPVGPGSVGARAARRSLPGLPRSTVDRADRAGRTARGRRRAGSVPQRPGARAHPSAAFNPRQPEGSVGRGRFWRDHGPRDCGGAGFRAAHSAAARGAHRKDGRVRDGRERRARAPAMAARAARRPTSLHSARRPHAG